jgi:hypothetical protein
MLSVVMLSVIMLSVIMLSVNMLSVVMLRVVTLNVIAPIILLSHRLCLGFPSCLNVIMQCPFF